MQTALRDLTTPRERPSYQLDGGRILQMRSPYDLTLEEYEALEGLYVAYGLILAKDLRERTEAEIAERQRMTRELTSIAFGTGDAHAVLGDLRATVALNDFLQLCAPVVRSLNAHRAEMPETPSASDSSSPSSAASTPAPRRGRGPRTRQSARSEPART